MPQRFRAKPSVVEAVQWNGHNWNELREFAGSRVVENAAGFVYLEIGPSGSRHWRLLPRWEWVLRWEGDPSDYWPMNPDYFPGKYEPIEEQPYVDS